MPDTLLVDHHARSLERFERLIAEAIGTLFPVRTQDGPIRFEGSTLGGGVWKHMSDRPTWVRPLRLSVEARGGSAYRTIADLPWTCGDVAREELDRVQGDAFPGIELGAHDGLFIGRPMVSLGQWLPGVGILAVYRPRPTGLATRVTVVPDAGSPIFLDREPGTAKITITAGRARGRYLPEELSPTADGSADSRALRRFREMFTIAPTPIRVAWFSAIGANRIEQTTGIPLSGGLLTPAHAAWVIDQLTAEEPPGTGETWRTATDLRLLGDIYLDAVWSAVRSALAGSRPRATNGDTARLLLDAIRRRTTSEIRTVLSGSGASMPLAIGEDSTNTLARIESRRKFTRFGPRGSSRPQRGLLSQRDLPFDYRGVLCPISTPESEDIGLVRFLAGGAEIDDTSRIAAPDVASERRDLSSAGELVPFVNHNDPVRASIGSRILRQAVVLDRPEPPLVLTGGERTIAETMGVVRSLTRGRVNAVDGDSISVIDPRGRCTIHPFGPARIGARGVESRWNTLVGIGDHVRKDDILAHAPDVVIEDGIPQLALGINCVVAYMPWHGLNYEDAIVVSESLAERFASFEEIVVREDLGESDIVTWVRAEQSGVDSGEAIAGVLRGEHSRNVLSPVTGVVADARETADYLEIRLLVRRSLAIGDKLTNRHGAKGVVSAVLPDGDMPVLPDGTVVEMITNPLGVLRRLNIAQFLETHVGLLAHLTGERPDVAGRTLADLDGLRRRLSDVGALNGRLPLSRGDTPGQTQDGVTVGVQYFVKLDHMAADKGQVRSGGRRSVRSHQPMPGSRWAGGLKTGGPQRMGEMEFWSLRAMNAATMIDDVLINRSDREPGSVPTAVGSTLLAVTAHLMAAGIEPVFETDQGTLVRGGSNEFESIDRSRVSRQWVEMVEPGSLTEFSPVAPPSDVRAADHPLYDDRHGGFDMVGTCPCGEETRPGYFCKACREMAVSRPQRDRRRVLFGIALCEPVPHPWFTDGTDPSDAPTLEILPVLPPAYRTYGRDPLDRRYLRVVAANTRLRDALDTGVGIQPARATLRNAVANVLGRRDDDPDRQTIAARLAGKTGLLRRYLLGRTTDMSGRGVIVPDPGLNPEHVGLPEWMYEELGFGRPTASALFDDVCVLNRQPSLHPYNLVALRARPVPGDAIRIHPLLCGAIAGDFDGDTVAIHRPAGRDAQRQAWETARPGHRLRSSASGRLLPNMDLDIALGLYLATRSRTGREELAARVGVAAPDRPLSGDTLSAFVERCADPTSEPHEQIGRLRRLMAAGFEAASGWSISLLETTPVPPDQVDALDQEALSREVHERVALSESLSQAVEAGVAGKPQVLIQLLGDRLPAPGFDPNLQWAPARTGNLLTGLSDDRYFACVNGALRSLAEKKLTTPYAGALTKALVEAAYDVSISKHDCGIEGPRSPLTCRNTEPCALCFGPDPADGQLLPVGFPVGVLSAQLIGERSTQLAMKSFHGGGTGVVVGGRVSQLYGLFGYGKFEFRNGHRMRLADVFAAAHDLEDVGDELLDVFTRLIDGEVLPVYAAVILRRLWNLYRRTQSTTLLAEAAVTGGALIDAATRGNLGVIVRDVGSAGRSDLTTGKLTVVMGGSGR